MAGGVEMTYGPPFLRYQLQTCVDAAYAEIGIRNRGAGRCMVRIDRANRGFYWVRVHGMCAGPEPEMFAEKLKRIGQLKAVELNGSKNYVKVWP